MNTQKFLDYCMKTKSDPTREDSKFGFVVYEWMEKKLTEECEKNRKLFWITINPAPEVGFTAFRRAVENLMKRTFMKGAYYTYEVRRLVADGYEGIHTHVAVEKLMSPKQMHDRLMSTFKGMIGNPKHIDIRQYDYTLLQDKIDYMSGKKWDDEKDEAIKASIKFRSELGLETCICNDCAKDLGLKK